MKHKIFALTAVFGISVALMTTAVLYAQGQSSGTAPGNPTLLKAIEDLAARLEAATPAIQSLQTSVASLQTSVANVQNSVANVQNGVDAISASDQSNVRFTPILSVKSAAISCWVHNVTTSPRSVRVQLIRYLDGSSALDATLLVPAESVRAASQAFVSLTGYCKFTVVGGVRSDIRANIEALDPGFSTSFLSVAAE